jgi:hypothetical protein
VRGRQQATGAKSGDAQLWNEPWLTVPDAVTLRQVADVHAVINFG